MDTAVTAKTHKIMPNTTPAKWKQQIEGMQAEIYVNECVVHIINATISYEYMRYLYVYVCMFVCLYYIHIKWHLQHFIAKWHHQHFHLSITKNYGTLAPPALLVTTVSTCDLIHPLQFLLNFHILIAGWAGQYWFPWCAQFASALVQLQYCWQLVAPQIEWYKCCVQKH